MDRPSSLLRQQQQQQHGVLRLPPGFRFHPTDEELVVQYLRRKVLCCPLPAVGIPEINLRKCDPWDLPGGCEEERYFFSLREAKYPHGSRSNRTTSSGYWKATGKDREVVSSRCSQAVVVGTKKVLVFHRGKPPAGSRTDWVMHEYRLAGTSFPLRKNSPSDVSQNQMVAGGDWVLCRIFKKKRATNMDAESEEQGTPSRSRAVYLAGRRGISRGPPASSDSSSCVTEASEDGSSSGEEATSVCMR